jgi:hypothetical protein
MTCTTHHICDCLQKELEELRAIPGPVTIYVGDPNYKTKQEFVLEQENAAIRSILQEAKKHLAWGEDSEEVEELINSITAALGDKND